MSPGDGGYALLRNAMVRQQIEARGIRDERVLEAMRRVPRHDFVREGQLGQAYADSALPIGWGQTISQPYMVAATCAQAMVDPGDRVLEVGAGSGYQAAVLAELAAEVITIERIPELAEQARQNLERAGTRGVMVVVGDGTLGYPEGAPYDVIVVAAAAPRIPKALEAQLAEGGRMIIPVGSRLMQTLRIVRKHGGRLTQVGSDACVYVPLVGDDGWPDDG